MKDLIFIGILAVILGLAIRYVIKSGKSGRKCIGCPNGSYCPSAMHAKTGCTCGAKPE